ncbi:MAG TPA: YceI family protein, partial [Chitinophagaceae bacterium]|nr:YceI family protein [Chitinophagaceae bacterium]
MSTKKWILDPAHSELQFKVKHLMVSNVTGSFADFQIETETASEDFRDARISATVKTGSVIT